MQRPFTGKDMAAILVGGFGIVIAVNFYMASVAIGGFGGVVVENSYVASQKFNGWLEEARESERLGYAAELSRTGDGRLLVATEGVPHYAELSADLRRPLGQPDDRSITFERTGDGLYASTDTLPSGRWIARVAIESGDERWVEETELQ
ncbi:FixH family protein [Qipengyuania sp. GH29]|nr:FixH family protein [Qipengyuania sphaerica]MBX7540921.1 FixH family protein [Qipengyuania sphaerica]